MPGPDPNFPDRWTNFFDMIDNIRIWTSTTSNSVVRFDYPSSSIGFMCAATNDKWYCMISDIATTLQIGTDDADPVLVARAQLVTTWLSQEGQPDLMSFINYYG